MFALGNLLVLAGYTLVYAAVANGGVFAADPFAGLTTDAYTQGRPAGPGGSEGGGSLIDGATSEIKHPSGPNLARLGGDLVWGGKDDPLSPGWFESKLHGLVGGGRTADTSPSVQRQLRRTVRPRAFQGAAGYGK